MRQQKGWAKLVKGSKEWKTWAVTNPPPRQSYDFDNTAAPLLDVQRELWYEVFAGESLPPRSDKEARANAYNNACRRWGTLSVYWCPVHELRRECVAGPGPYPDIRCPRACQSCFKKRQAATAVYLAGDQARAQILRKELPRDLCECSCQPSKSDK